MTTTTLEKPITIKHELNTAEIPGIIEKQYEYFYSGATRSYDFRIEQLKRLKQMIKENEELIEDALKADLNKPKFEAYASEIGFMYEEINFTIEKLHKWMRPEKVDTPLIHQPSSSRIISEPLGVVLIIGAWNYPFQLTISPLVGAIAAGNCSLVKPSELAPRTSDVVAELVAKYFDPEYVAAVPGGVEVSQALLEHRYDHIFFTGSTQVGRIIAQAAAKHLTPTTLELGGKSPCIVDEKTDIKISARRIAWGKYFNAGQTCVAPDYLLLPASRKDEFIKYFKESVREFYGEDPSTSPDYCRIVSRRHYDRLAKFLNDGEVVLGGRVDADQLYIEPTLLDGVSPDAPIMQEEIFGPILPIIEYDDLDDAVRKVRSRPTPLARWLRRCGW